MPLCPGNVTEWFKYSTLTMGNLSTIASLTDLDGPVNPVWQATTGPKPHNNVVFSECRFPPLPQHPRLAREQLVVNCWNHHSKHTSQPIHVQRSPWSLGDWYIMLANWLLLFLCLGAVQRNVSAFNPSNYARSAARCIATRRGLIQQDVHIELSMFLPERSPPFWLLIIILEYVDINPDASTTLLMVHGWPGLWSTWSKQIEEFQVRCIVKIKGNKIIEASTFY